MRWLARGGREGRKEKELLVKERLEERGKTWADNEDARVEEADEDNRDQQEAEEKEDEEEEREAEKEVEAVAAGAGPGPGPNGALLQ